MKTTTGSLYDRIIKLKRKFRQENRIANGLLDAVPLVDIALLLFIFFIVNSSLVLRPGVVVKLPSSPFASGVEYGNLIVTISQESMVFFNDERLPLEGLSSAFSQAVHEKPGSTLIIEADERVPHSTLVKIYNMAMEAGIKEAALCTRVSAPTISE